MASKVTVSVPSEAVGRISVFSGQAQQLAVDLFKSRTSIL